MYKHTHALLHTHTHTYTLTPLNITIYFTYYAFALLLYVCVQQCRHVQAVAHKRKPEDNLRSPSFLPFISFETWRSLIVHCCVGTPAGLQLLGIFLSQPPISPQDLWGDRSLCLALYGFWEYELRSKCSHGMVSALTLSHLHSWDSALSVPCFPECFLQ